MPESKQPHLNGAYYGPSIPPPSKSYQRPSRGGGGGGCGICSCLFSCICGCIFNLIFQIVLTIVILLGIAVLIFWLIFRPNPVKFHVTDARLTQFDYSTANNTLYYNLALNMTVRNPNKRIGIYYDRIEARAIYHGERLQSTDLPKFYQGHKRTDFLNPSFSGQHLVTLDSKDQTRFTSERDSGTFNIDVKLYLRIRFKLGWAKTPKFKPKIECDLKVPLDSNGRASGTFEAKKCGLDW